MKKVNCLISKNVISLDEGKKLGYVLDVVFDDPLKTFQGLIVVDEESENNFFLPEGRIVSTGENCVMVESEMDLEFQILSSSNNPIGKEVYDEKGGNLGRVCDVFCEGKRVKKIATNKCEIPQKYIKKSGVNYIIFGIYSNKKKNKSNNFFKNKIEVDNIKDKLPKVVISSAVENRQENLISVGASTMPMRLFAGDSFLLGRTVTKDLFGMNNEIIARKNEKIDKKIIKNAKNHNKLNFLAFFSQ